jgi:hypothetical protein
MIMARYVAMGMVIFEGEDAWAQGNAQWLKDNTEVLAQQSALINEGKPTDRTSYFGAFRELESGELELVSAWHINSQGDVIQGLPDPNDVIEEPEEPPEIPEWQAGIAYATNDEVRYGDIVYRCITGHTSQVGWEPPNVPALWSPL